MMEGRWKRRRRSVQKIHTWLTWNLERERETSTQSKVQLLTIRLFPWILFLIPVLESPSLTLTGQVTSQNAITAVNQMYADP